MKKEIYSSAWDSITMSDECFGEILDSIEEVPVITKRPRKKVSYLAVLTAAAVFMCGGIGVAAQAGAFDWIKAFFVPGIVVNTEDFSDIIGKMEDFECKSDVGAKFSPVGVIFDGYKLYCMLRIDKMPNGMDNASFLSLYHIKLGGREMIDSDGNRIPCSLGTSLLSEADLASNFIGDNDDVPDLLALDVDFRGREEKGLIKDGDRITLELYYCPCIFSDIPEDDQQEDVKIADVSFTLQNGRYSVLDIDYSKYTCDEIPKRQYDFLFDTMKITSLEINAEGRSMFYGDAITNDDMKVVLDDGSEVKAESTATFTVPRIDADENKIQYLPTVKERVEARGTQTYSRWAFTKPVDPERIVKIYLDDMCIYKKQ